MAAVSPLIAGYLYQVFGMQATLFFVAILFVTSAVVFASADLAHASDLQMEPSGEC
jgi:hypothetical protein